MHTNARATGPGGVSPAFRAVLPFAKLLDVGLEEAAIVWGCFVGQVFRGVKFVVELVHSFTLGLLSDVETLDCLECGIILVCGFINTRCNLLQRL